MFNIDAPSAARQRSDGDEGGGGLTLVIHGAGPRLRFSFVSFPITFAGPRDAADFMCGTGGPGAGPRDL